MHGRGTSVIALPGQRSFLRAAADPQLSAQTRKPRRRAALATTVEEASRAFAPQGRSFCAAIGL